LTEKDFLESEVGMLNYLISQTPAEDVIDLKSLESRKKEVQDHLAILKGGVDPPGY
jgi:hypothetical protein